MQISFQNIINIYILNKRSSTPSRARTYGLLLRRQLLYPLSYWSVKYIYKTLWHSHETGKKEINSKELLLKAHYLHRPCACSIHFIVRPIMKLKEFTSIQRYYPLIVLFNP